MVQASAAQTVSTGWPQCPLPRTLTQTHVGTSRHIQAHTRHTQYTLRHIEESHTRQTVRQRKGPIWLESLFCPVFTKHEKDQFGEDGYFSSAVCWDPTTMMEEEKKQETLDPHCVTLPG